MKTKTPAPAKAKAASSPAAKPSKLKPRPGKRKGREIADVPLIEQPIVREGPMTPFREGVITAGLEGDEAEAAIKKAERAEHAKKLLKEIADQRELDKSIYARIAKDRMYAHGAGQFRIKVNLIQTYTELWVNILYARDPQVQVMPGEAVSDRGRQDARDMAKTMQIIVQRLISRGALKRSARKWVRAAMSVGVGALRSNWMERVGKDPVVIAKLDDIQDNIAQVSNLQRELTENGPDYLAAEATKAELDVAMKALEANVEKVISRGMIYDFIPTQDITVSGQVDSWMDYIDSPWVDIRYFKSIDDIKKMLPHLTDEQLNRCSTYSRDPEPDTTNTPATSQVSARQADTYTKSSNSGYNADRCQFLCIHEMEHRDDGVIYTLIEGLDDYAREPTPPTYYTTRFYDIFLLAFTDTDGMRYPESLNTRSHSLQDEYSRTRSKFSIHRDRVVPKVLFNKAKLDKTTATSIMRAATGEWVGVKVNANIDMSKLFFVPTYPVVDPGLYDTSQTLRDMEVVWGMQEALTGPVQIAKTATEAKIQESGTQARTTSKRDALEDALTEVTQFTAQIAIQVFTPEEAREIAGPKALWLPEGFVTPDNIDTVVNVEIKAGSSGKPDTLAEIERWEKEMPLIADAIQQIATLRNASPLEVADCLEALVEETLQRFGERGIELSRFIPQGMIQPEIDPVTGMPVKMPGMADIAAGAIPGMPIPDGPLPTPGGPAGVPGGDPQLPIAPEQPHPRNVDQLTA